MILTAQQIIEQQLLKLDEAQGKPAQVGFDLSLKAIQRIIGGGKVLKDRTELPTYEDILFQKEENGWWLVPGTYDITFNEGCRIPANLTAKIRQRSSLLRNGAVIASSIFDPGFETDNMGTVMIVTEPIFIEKDARVAQIYFDENYPVSSENLYNGQWMYDKQRSK